MMWWSNDGWSWWEWLLMSVGMIAFWAFIAWMVVMVVRQTQRPSDDQPDGEAILNQRFARGEIDEDEYRTRLRALRELGTPAQPRPSR